MSKQFADLGIQESIIKALSDLKIVVPTEIQQKAIPLLLAQTDVVGLAKTGTGKTAAFGLPLLQLIDTNTTTIQAVILVPTRELGHQIFESKLYTEQLDTSGTYFAANVTNSFQLGKGWNADVRGDYQSNIVYAQLLIKSFGTLNLGIQKKILNDKGSIKLSLSDILYTRRADGIINNLKDTDADWNSTLDTRSATIAFSYRFGKSTSNKSKYTGSGSDSEQRRVKG